MGRIVGILALILGAGWAAFGSFYLFRLITGGALESELAPLVLIWAAYGFGTVVVAIAVAAAGVLILRGAARGKPPPS